MPRAAKIIVRVILIMGALSGLPPACEAQNKTTVADYDYYSLATATILDSAAEASKLPDVPQRVKLLINAANLLPASQHNDAIRLLGIALRDVKEWSSDDKATWNQRHTATALLNEVLASYARLDPEQAKALQKTFQAEAKSTTIPNLVTALKTAEWRALFSDQRAISDQAAKIALSLLDSEPDQAVRLVVQSGRRGTVSSVLFDIIQRLIQSGNRTLLDKLEVDFGQVVAANPSLDPSNVNRAAILMLADKEMPLAARKAFGTYFVRSLQETAVVIRQPEIDAVYISAVFTNYSLTVRSVMLQYAPEELLMFDLALDQIAPFVPEKTKSRTQAFQPETFSEPRDRLNDILKDANSEKRDLRLVRLVSELLRDESEDLQNGFDLATDAINGFSDPDIKSAYADLLTVVRINKLAKKKKFIEAQQLARSISSDETRAWALLALARVTQNADRVLGFELISNALKALDGISPSPHKVELALAATAMLVNDDPQRAFDTLARASTYANSSAARVALPTKPPVAFGLEATIGDGHSKLGVFPESLGELRIDPALAGLGTKDWFRAGQIVSTIREPSLRLQLKLELAGSVLSQSSKPKRKETTSRPATRN